MTYLGNGLCERMAELETAISAIRQAGNVVMKHYGRVTPSSKADKSLVTKADIESENLIKTILQKKFPDYPILGEETGLTGQKSDYLWIVDPLDGTTNYTFRNPFFDISIGLAYKGNPILGAVLFPPQDELFYAKRGSGAYLNNSKIGVSDRKEIDDSIITFCHGRDKDSVRRMIDAFSQLKVINQKVRQLGAAALELCYVANGRVDAFFMTGMNPWDVAAGTVILREAGGTATDFQGKAFNMNSHDILGSNCKIHEGLLNVLKKV